VTSAPRGVATTKTPKPGDGQIVIDASSDALFDAALLDDQRSDVYFLRAREILQAEGLNPIVTMEFFPSRSGLLAGVPEVLGLLRRVIPRSGEVWALEEGSEFERKQVALRVTAPYQSFGVYETAILGIFAQESGWATAARACVEAAAGTPVSSFGARHVHPLVSPRLDYAAVVGGCDSCSTPLGAKLAGVPVAGTTPHSLILILGDTARAIQAFDRVIPESVRRITLVDTLRDEAEEAVAVADAMAEIGRRLDGVRLDTPGERGGVTVDLIHEVRARLDLAGHANVQIVVSGGVTPERIVAFRAGGAPVDFYGVGSFISGGPPIDFTADIKAIEGRPVAKRGRLPGLTPSPHLRRVL
jgi:nicotinate phosphoribosyltransferase